MTKVKTTWKGFKGIPAVYLADYGFCFYADSINDLPTQGEKMHYYGSEEDFMIYGTDENGTNKHTSDGNVEFWAVKS